MYSWLTFYHSGHEVANDFRPHMTDLQTRIQRVWKRNVPKNLKVPRLIILSKYFQTRENFNSSRDDIQALMRKMLEVRQSVSICNSRVIMINENCLVKTYVFS